MTEPIDYQSAIPAEKRYFRVTAWIAWVVIVGVVGFIVVAVMKPQLKGKSPSVGTDAMTNDLTYRLTMGEFYTFKGWGILKADTKLTLVNQTRGVGEPLQVVPIIAEIDGKDAALKELDKHSSTTQPTTRPTAETALRKIYTEGTTSLSPDDRTAVKSLGFPGELALAYTEHGADESELARDARGRFVGMLSWMGVMIVLSITGLVLMIVGIILLATGKLKLVGLPLWVPGIPLVEAFALYLLVFFGASIGFSFLHITGIVWEFPLILLLVLIFSYVHLRGQSWQSVFHAFGWYTGKGVFQEIFAGIVGYIAGLPILIVGFTIAIILMKVTGAKASHPITGMVKDVSPWMLYALACVWAPIFEETMFRGALLHHLRRAMPWIGAAPIVSVIFAMIHPQGLAFIPALGAIAMMLAALREWRGSIIAPMVAHGLSNAATVTLLMVMVK